jgi:hypothetical protein
MRTAQDLQYLATRYAATTTPSAAAATRIASSARGTGSYRALRPARTTEGRRRGRPARGSALAITGLECLDQLPEAERAVVDFLGLPPLVFGQRDLRGARATLEHGRSLRAPLVLAAEHDQELPAIAREDHAPSSRRFCLRRVPQVPSSGRVLRRAARLRRSPRTRARPSSGPRVAPPPREDKIDRALLDCGCGRGLPDAEGEGRPRAPSRVRRAPMGFRVRGSGVSGSMDPTWGMPREQTKEVPDG